MKTKEIQEKARQVGLIAKTLDKEELIRAIQQKEGNFPCFGSAKGYCDQSACSWRKDCIPN